MSIDEQHVALPKLYGAPAYGRPPRPFDIAPRPLDPDDLPLEAERTDEDVQQWVAAALQADAANGHGLAGGSSGEPRIEGRPFTLRSLGRILSGRP